MTVIEGLTAEDYQRIANEKIAIVKERLRAHLDLPSLEGIVGRFCEVMQPAGYVAQAWIKQGGFKGFIVQIMFDADFIEIENKE